jgi:uncharacterized Zn-binding protein involved in type VI secretion
MRTHRSCLWLLAIPAAALGFAATASAGPPPLTVVDNGICPFPLKATVVSDTNDHVLVNGKREILTGMSTVTLTNLLTGVTATLRSPGSIP